MLKEWAERLACEPGGVHRLGFRAAKEVALLGGVTRTRHLRSIKRADSGARLTVC